MLKPNQKLYYVDKNTGIIKYAIYQFTDKETGKLIIIFPQSNKYAKVDRKLLNKKLFFTYTKASSYYHKDFSTRPDFIPYEDEMYL